MIHFFRSMLNSKIGVGIALGFLFLIALAFAGGDVASSGGFGGVAGGDRVASIGDERIDTATLSQASTSQLERVKQRDPTISMEVFLANGGLEGVLDNLIDRLAITVFGKTNGIVASDRLIDSEITQMGAFRGADGRFSDDLFRQMIQQRGISEKLLRDDLSQGLVARQVMMPASIGIKMPAKMATRYASLLTETRKGEVAVLPTLLFAPKDKPTDEQIDAYYNENQNDFIRPERRVIRYATFSPGVLKNVPEPTEAEIAFRYNTNKKQYEATERRRIKQLVIPTEAAAKAVMAELSSGTSLVSSAKAKGLSVSTLEFLSSEELSLRFSQPFADTVFDADKGAIIAPMRSALGWHIASVTGVERTPARTLDDLRDELAQAISKEKLNIAMSDTLEAVEDSFNDGASLIEGAETLGIELKSTLPLTADGRIYLKPGKTIPADLGSVLKNAFVMETAQPQLAEIKRGETFLIYDVSEITASGPAPLKDIRKDVKSVYLMKQASAAAKEAVLKIQTAMADGKTMKQALKALGKRLPPVQKVRMARPDLARMQQQRRQIPRPVALMFNMAQGTTKVQSGPNEQAWFVVSLTEIEPGKVSAEDEIVGIARTQLGAVMSEEISDALGRAIRDEMGVERNQAGIDAVRKQLGGES